MSVRVPTGALPDVSEQAEVEVLPLPSRAVDWSRVRPVEWLWEGRIPVGKLSLLVAEEGGGKGTVLAWLAVQVIRGELPGDRQGLPQRVLVIGDEDGFEDTWIPRMYAAGATREEIQERVLLLDANLDLVRDEARLLATVRRDGIGWVIVDQVLDHIDGGKDGSAVYNPSFIRNVLIAPRRVARLAEIAVTGNLHPIKGSPKSFRDLIGGSHQMNAVSRSSLWLGYDPDSEDSTARVLVRGKGNLSTEPPCFEFSIVGRQFELNGHDFDMPVVDEPREGTRYRRDFEGGTGFGKESKAATLPAHEVIAGDVFDLLTDEEQSIAAIDRQIEGRSRETVTQALKKLQKDGRAVKGRGWKRNPDYEPPPPPPPEPDDDDAPKI